MQDVSFIAATTTGPRKDPTMKRLLFLLPIAFVAAAAGKRRRIIRHFEGATAEPA